ncbi:MAG TPA: hypothetical protein VMV20_01030 [Chitinophagaceae bacterium]|nr:hypothetical protein [Chitinophagaceae bacterium]
MEWYLYIASFFSWVFLANSVPHFIHGISGDPFPTPFSKPSGKALSSPTTNVVWGLSNLVLGYLLLGAGGVNHHHFWSMLVFFTGIAAMSLTLSMGRRERNGPK